MAEPLSRQEAEKLGDDLKAMWQVIQHAHGEALALQVALGTALSGLPPDSPLRAQVLSALEGYRQQMLLDPRSLGALEGFASVHQALAIRMGERTANSDQIFPSGNLN